MVHLLFSCMYRFSLFYPIIGVLYAQVIQTISIRTSSLVQSTDVSPLLLCHLVDRYQISVQSKKYFRTHNEKTQ